METLSKVSIVINNYNYERYLAEAIESALGQTYANCEVIVVDDGSTDGSRQLIEEYGGRVRAVYKENGGQASAFNVGFEALTGEWIIFLDADDALEPTCVEVCMKEVDTDCARMVYRLSYIDQNSDPLDVLNQRAHSRAMVSNYAVDFKAGVFRPVDGTPTSGNLFSRWALERILPVADTERFRICADQYLFLHTAAVGKVGCIDHFLAKYRLHGANNFASEELCERLVQSRLLNLKNRNFLKKEIFNAHGSEFSESEYYRSWEDFESMFLAQKYGIWPLEGEQQEFRIFKANYGVRLLGAVRAAHLRSLLMLIYAYSLKLLPLCLCRGLFKLNRSVRSK